ncbi:hypothetical protein Emin_1193 [Elusimicrobium minutum Pei191]|uniref:Uncharacterized protein n=1 Tax=Elusimicrobium minutum (strain Pei191) TaxID=445932 RepID=B2KDZ7_ELUMP|nr:hypothetical protein [Elusimicrobium minutum]ACC98743.1 hypothetical protein Emin_1193 [Elusimicrobium minutum Pei191]
MKRILFVLFIITAIAAKADFFPNPAIDFTFKFNTQKPLEIVPEKSDLILCDDYLCQEGKPLGAYGIQKLYCSKTECRALLYDFASYGKLSITFSDGKTRQSGVFKGQEQILSDFIVEVNHDSLNVTFLEAANSSPELLRADTIFSMAVTLIIEILAALAFIKVMKKPVKIVWAVLIANLISIPLAWFWLPIFIPESYMVWVIALIFEISVVYILNRKKILLHDAVMVGLVTKIASYSLGMALAFILAPFLV